MLRVKSLSRSSVFGSTAGTWTTNNLTVNYEEIQIFYLKHKPNDN